MIINDDIVFIHLQKCGGTFIKHMMEQHMNAVNIRPEHNGFGDIAKKDADKLVIGTIRDPYSWYVSLYHSHLPDADTSFFSETFKGTNNFAEWVKKFLTLKGVRYHDLDFNVISRMNVGPYTYRMIRCYADKILSGIHLNSKDIVLGDIEIIKTTDLAEDFVKLVDQKIGFKEEVKERILASDMIHTTSHEHYNHYYDDEAYELVEYKDRLIFELFGYEHER